MKYILQLGSSKIVYFYETNKFMKQTNFYEDRVNR